ncbi:LysR family transcriptional regulator [Algihabitans albus]|uniref:LysR family transcriptional regulator n=1 Tax=Algihabitans albus TaxID=2164067 RepID=UPI000E5D90BD|nr:LysR family transcriptional regulator [Algihabitans albus]
MNLRQLEAFRMAMLHGSITRAAKAMRLSQPAVTKLIAALEQEVGFRLFDRAPGGVIPTPEAIAFHEELERSYLGLQRLAQSAREIRDLRRGHVRIAAMPALATDLVPSIISRFSATYPDIRISLDVHTSPRIADLTAAAAFDFGFAHLPNRRPDLTVVASYEMACVVAMPPGHPLAARKMIRPQDLDGVAMVALSHHTVTARHVDQMFIDADVTPQIRGECQPSFAACALVARGVGISIVDPLTPAMFGEDTLSVRPLDPLIPFHFRLIRPAGLPQSRAAAAVMDDAIATVEASPLIERTGRERRDTS